VREQASGFVPSHNVPITRLREGGNRTKKPKKPKPSRPDAKAEAFRPQRQGDKSKRRKPGGDAMRCDSPRQEQPKGQGLTKKKGGAQGTEASEDRQRIT
jgi:hypothetical protein